MKLNQENFLYIYLFIFGVIFLIALGKVLDIRDEIYYLSDSLLLIEGMRPSFSHSPTGLSTWVGTIPVLINFLINIFSNLGDLNLINIFKLFDLAIYQNYKNLIYIKLSLFSLNLLGLIILYKVSQKENLRIFFNLFILLSLLPFFYTLTFAGKPLFIASIFFSISLIFNQNQKYTLSVIFYALAVSERLEYLIFFTYILSAKRPKELVAFIIIIAAISPWFTSAIIQNVKVLIVYLVKVESYHSQLENNLNNLFLFLLIISSLSYKYFKKHLLTTLVIIVISLVIINKVPIRWLYPIFIFILFQLSIKIKKININLIYIHIASLILCVFCITNILKIESDDNIQLKQLSENNLLTFGVPLLKENMKFNIFSKYMTDYINTTNIKNNNFFKKTSKPPIAFGESGNLERLHFRRYYYLYHFSDKQKYDQEKIIYGESGLYLNKNEWCELLNRNDICG